MKSWLHHLPVLPIVVPLVAGAVMLLFAESQRRTREGIAFIATLAQLATGATLLYMTTDAVPDVWRQGIGVYSISAWPAPYGIVLIVDRLSALMVTLARTGRIDKLSGGTCKSDDFAAVKARMASFMAAGFLQICGKRG